MQDLFKHWFLNAGKLLIYCSQANIRQVKDQIVQNYKKCFNTVLYLNKKEFIPFNGLVKFRCRREEVFESFLFPHRRRRSGRVFDGGCISRPQGLHLGKQLL